MHSGTRKKSHINATNSLRIAGTSQKHETKGWTHFPQPFNTVCSFPLLEFIISRIQEIVIKLHKNALFQPAWMRIRTLKKVLWKQQLAYEIWPTKK